MEKISFIILILLSNLSFGQQNKELKINYFGQTYPCDSAMIFAPEILSLTDSFENGITFSSLGDECCFARYDG